MKVILPDKFNEPLAMMAAAMSHSPLFPERRYTRTHAAKMALVLGLAQLELQLGTTAYDVVLTHHGTHKINVIKAIRSLTGLGLKEAKLASEQTPSVIRAGLQRAEAEAALRELREAGGIAELRGA